MVSGIMMISQNSTIELVCIFKPPVHAGGFLNVGMFIPPRLYNDHSVSDRVVDWTKIWLISIGRGDYYAVNSQQYI